MIINDDNDQTKKDNNTGLMSMEISSEIQKILPEEKKFLQYIPYYSFS